MCAWSMTPFPVTASNSKSSTSTLPVAPHRGGARMLPLLWAMHVLCLEKPLMHLLLCSACTPRVTHSSSVHNVIHKTTATLTAAAIASLTAGRQPGGSRLECEETNQPQPDTAAGAHLPCLSRPVQVEQVPGQVPLPAPRAQQARSMATAAAAEQSV